MLNAPLMTRLECTSPPPVFCAVMPLPECLLPRFHEAGRTIHHGVRESAIMEMESLKELYVDELKDLYSAEKQLVKALPRMAKNASNPELKQAFTEHLEETEGHVERLEQI